MIASTPLSKSSRRHRNDAPIFALTAEVFCALFVVVMMLALVARDADSEPVYISIAIDHQGQLWLDRERLTSNRLLVAFEEKRAAHPGYAIRVAAYARSTSSHVNVNTGLNKLRALLSRHPETQAATDEILLGVQGSPIR